MSGMFCLDIRDGTVKQAQLQALQSVGTGEYPLDSCGWNICKELDEAEAFKRWASHFDIEGVILTMQLEDLQVGEGW
jgi:hypothetical protein